MRSAQFLIRIILKWLERMGTIPAVALTYLIVLIGWVFFRAPDFSYAFSYLGQMFSFSGSQLTVYTGPRFWFFMVLAVTFSFAAVYNRVEQWGNRFFENELHLGWLTTKALLCLMLGGLCLAEIFASGFNPFIYFQF